MFGRTSAQNQRHHQRLAVGGPAIVSWESDGSRREATGRCIDLSKGGASIRLAEQVPVSTLVRVKFPDLEAEAAGVVRRTTTDAIGIEFTRLMYYGRTRKSKQAALPGKYMAATLALVLAGILLYTNRSALPQWVPFSERSDWPSPAAHGLELLGSVRRALPEWLNLPAAGDRQVSNFFTLHSNRSQVLAAQGPPTHMTDTTWYYGLSRVFFRGDVVVGWAGSADTPLHVGAKKPAKATGGRDRFTVGSTESDVLAAQGPPTELNGTTWKYGASEVYFKEGKVIGWNTAPGQSLNVEPGARR